MFNSYRLIVCLVLVTAEANDIFRRDIRISQEDLRNAIPVPLTSLLKQNLVNSSDGEFILDTSKAIFPVRLSRFLSKLSRTGKGPDIESGQESTSYLNADNNYLQISQTDFPQIFLSKGFNSKLTDLNEDYSPADMSLFTPQRREQKLWALKNNKIRNLNNADFKSKKKIWPKIYLLNPEDRNIMKQYQQDLLSDFVEEQKQSSSLQGGVSNRKTVCTTENLDGLTNRTEDDSPMEMGLGNTTVSTITDSPKPILTSSMPQNDMEFNKSITCGDVKINLSLSIEMKPKNTSENSFNKKKINKNKK